MGKQYKLEKLRLLTYSGLGDEPFVAEVLVKDEDDEFWLPIEVEGRAQFDPYNFDDTFEIEIDTDDLELRRYLEKKLKEDFRDLVKKTLKENPIGHIKL